MRDARGLTAAMTAAIACGLKEVDAATKLVILGQDGSQSTAIAREVTSLGFRGYTLAGGFGAWRAAGLPVTTKRGDYAVSPGAYASPLSHGLPSCLAHLVSLASNSAHIVFAALLRAWKRCDGAHCGRINRK